MCGYPPLPSHVPRSTLMCEEKQLQLSVLLKEHKYHGRSWDSNPYSNDSAIRTDDAPDCSAMTPYIVLLHRVFSVNFPGQSWLLTRYFTYYRIAFWMWSWRRYQSYIEKWFRPKGNHLRNNKFQLLIVEVKNNYWYLIKFIQLKLPKVNFCKYFLALQNV